MPPSVVIIMGSDSDKDKMAKAKEVLTDLGVESEMRISSAHRTPDKTRRIVRESEEQGCKVFICGAGMAAHLAGAVASETCKPVIGVPLTSTASPLQGVDALYATVQMPPGMPVATVAIDRADNAAWLAAQILALDDKALALKISEAREAIAQKIDSKDLKLRTEQQ